MNKGSCFHCEEVAVRNIKLEEENARLREAVSSYQKSFDMEKRLFDITVKELREENARLHEYNRKRWNVRGGGRMSEIDFGLPVEHKPHYLYYNPKEDFIENLAKDLWVHGKFLNAEDAFSSAERFYIELEKRRKEKALEKNE
jgi:hypothetical protein